MYLFLTLSPLFTHAANRTIGVYAYTKQVKIHKYRPEFLEYPNFHVG